MHQKLSLFFCGFFVVVFFGLTRWMSTLPDSNSYQVRRLNSGLARLYFITYWKVHKLQTSHYLHHLLIALLPFPSNRFLAFTPLLFFQQPSTKNTVHDNYCTNCDVMTCNAGVSGSNLGSETRYLNLSDSEVLYVLLGKHFFCILQFNI